MNHLYLKVIGCILLSISGYSLSISQSTGPDFLECSSTPDSLCVQDEGVRLPANNQLYVGEGHPGATSCSVHITQKKLVLSTCGGSLQYEVQLFLNDTLPAYILKSLTIIAPDSNGIGELNYNTEESPDAQISTAGIPYTAGCQIYHRIKWIVTDACGMESVCEQWIDLYDCNAPLVSNDPDEITIVPFPIGGLAHLFAKDFIHDVIDDCTQEGKFLFSLKENEYKPDSFLFCCNVPAYGVEISYDVWLADEGRDLDCDGSIAWSERRTYVQPVIIVFIDNASCCEPGDFPVFGQVTDNYQRAIANVGVSINIPGQFHSTYITSNNGQYYFNADPDASIITIFAEKNDHHKNGVSTLDLIKIQRHLLGKEEFTSPYQYFAADASNSQNVSAIDLIEIRKLILGVYTEFPFNQSWKFVRKDYVFDDPMNPWYGSDPGTITILNGNVPSITDFIGIKIGDLNGTAQPNYTDIKPRGVLQPFNLLTAQVLYKAGEIIQVPIRMSSGQALTGFQFTLNTTGMEVLDVISDRITLSDGDFGLFGDKMTISWFDENTVEVSNNDVLFTLVMRTTQSGTLSQSLNINSDITDAEIYLDGEQTFLPVLNVINSIAANDLSIMSCAPNPWKDETTLSFYLPEKCYVTYNVSDVNGRNVYSEGEYLQEGYHNYTLKASDFSARGMLFLEINSGRFSVVQKMIVLE